MHIRIAAADDEAVDPDVTVQPRLQAQDVITVVAAIPEPRGVIPTDVTT
jgi:hypothetical protein